MPSLARLRALSWADRGLFAEACCRLLVAWTALKLVRFERLISSLHTVAVSGAPADPALVRRVRWAVESGARHLPLTLTCLPQALASTWMLRARGYAPRLNYGVAKNAAGFEAHAWVEVDDLAVVGHRAAEGFTLLARFPQNPDSR